MIVAFMRRHLLLARLRTPSHLVCWLRSIGGAGLVYLAAWWLRTLGVVGYGHRLVGPLVVFALLLHIHYRSRGMRMRALEQMATISQAAERLREALDILQVAGASEVREALDHINWVLHEALPDVNGKEVHGGARLQSDRLKQLEQQVRNALTVLHHLDVLTGEGYKERALAGAIAMLEKGLQK